MVKIFRQKTTSAEVKSEEEMRSLRKIKGKTLEIEFKMKYAEKN